MSDSAPPPDFSPAEPTPASGSAVPPPAAAPAPYGAPSAPAAYAAAPSAGPIGQVRSTGMCFLLTIVTLGIYTGFWYFKVHEEMKRHTGTGIGGGIALILAIFVGIASPFLASAEAGAMRERAGQEKKVSGLTGLWVLIPLLGSIIWFVKTNGALNDYWKSLGAS